MWPPNSPDLNPVDYAFRGALQQTVYQRLRFTTVNQLKQTIVNEWGKLSHRFTDRAIVQRRCRLDISQGSVATHLRCGGIFTDSIIINFLLFLQ